jgi:transcriptional regulator with XRE-family HTH domain
MKLRQIVAKNLRILRKQKGLSQEELAFQAGINRNYVGQIEREEKSPTIDVIERIGNALKIPPMQLLSNGDRTISKVVVTTRYPRKLENL